MSDALLIVFEVAYTRVIVLSHLCKDRVGFMDCILLWLLVLLIKFEVVENHLCLLPVQLPIFLVSEVLCLFAKKLHQHTDRLCQDFLLLE